MSHRLATVFFIVGACLVVVGGLVAAVTGPLALADGSWLAAYLVLVCGVALCVVGRAQEHLAARPVPDWLGWVQFCCWNVGNAGVVAGTLLAAPPLVDTGGVILLAGLIIALWAMRAARGSVLLHWVYRAALIIMIVSIPVGLALAQIRAA